MATAEKQQKNPIKQEPDDEKPQLNAQRQQPKQVDEEDDDYYSDEYDDDYDDYYDDDDDQDNQALQSYGGGQTISSKDQDNRPIQNNSSITRAEGSKKSIDDEEGLKLKVDVNLDIEIELKARIHGDLTLALLT